MNADILGIRSDHVWIDHHYVPAVILIDAVSGRIRRLLRGSGAEAYCGRELCRKDDYILPGLIDCHTHAGMDGPGGDRNDDINDPAHFDVPFFRAIDAADPFQDCFRKARMAGITTVCVLPGSGCAVGGQAGVMLTGAKDPFGYVVTENAGMMVALGTQPRRAADSSHCSPMTKMALYAMIRESCIKARLFLRQKQAARDLGAEGWAPVLEGRTPVRAHCHREDDIAKLIRFAEEEGLKLVLEHGTEALYLTEELLSRDIPVVCTDTLMRVPQYYEERSACPQLPSLMMKRGIRTALSSGFPEAAWDQLIVQFCRCIKEGVPYETVIDSVTRVPAQILGLEGEMGAIREGNWADLSFWTGDLASFQTVPRGVMIRGILYGEKGQCDE